MSQPKTRVAKTRRRQNRPIPKHSPVDASVLKPVAPKHALADIRKLLAVLPRELKRPSAAVRRKRGMNAGELLDLIALVSNARDALDVQAKRLAATARQNGAPDHELLAALNAGSSDYLRWTEPHPLFPGRDTDD